MPMAEWAQKNYGDWHGGWVAAFLKASYKDVSGEMKVMKTQQAVQGGMWFMTRLYSLTVFVLTAV